MADPVEPVADLPRDRSAPPGVTSTNVKLAVAAAVGAVATVVMGLAAGWQFSGLVGWDVAAVVITSWTLWEIWPMDAERTARTAVREEPARALTDLMLVGASVASLVGVGFVVVAGGNSRGAGKGLLVALAVLTVVVSWAVVHTTYTLRYARLFYSGADGGLDFHSPNREVPQYSDFAYAAFTIGMTFQVSDTEVTTKEMRATILRHALLAYLFGVVIIAIMINLVAGLTK
ncbi:MAG: hypothetical protein QOJ62_51 [Actinomycetota bacterium]|jgi:uncharacterized membrane protein|nr:hypothetical protein [Actinomycetota bacterium]